MERMRTSFIDPKELISHLTDESHLGQPPQLTKEQQQQFGIEETKKRKIYTCSFDGCGKSFTDTSNKRKHEKIHDTNRERYFCTTLGCTRSYSTKPDLKIHLKTHSGDLPHKCSAPGCKRAFTRLSELLSHERMHDNLFLFECKCGKRFRDKRTYRKHSRGCVLGETRNQ